MIYRHLVVDNKCDNRITEIVTQREHGVTIFEVRCLNNGYDIDLTECTQAQFYGEKSDGHRVGVKCDFNGDKTAVLLPLILQMTTAEGLLNGVLELSFESGNIRFSGINFKVVSAPDDTKIESKDEFTVFENCLLKPEQGGKVGQVLTLGSDGKNVWKTVQGGSGGTSDYEYLDNKPRVNGVELVGDKSLNDLNIKQDYTADDIVFADGDTFQQKFDKGELKGQRGDKGEQGLQGEKGENGEKGQDGADGRTPEKVVDYFTDEDKSEFATEITETLKPELDKKQDILVSGQNIKTVNRQSLLGNGNIEFNGANQIWKLIKTVSIDEDVQAVEVAFDNNDYEEIVMIGKHIGSSQSSSNHVLATTAINDNFLGGGFGNFFPSANRTLYSYSIIHIKPTLYINTTGGTSNGNNPAINFQGANTLFVESKDFMKTLKFVPNSTANYLGKGTQFLFYAKG